MPEFAAFIQGPGLPLRANTRLRSGVRMCAPTPSDRQNSQNSQPPKKSKPAKKIKSSATWANVFLPEFGSKGPGSRPQADLRPKSLRPKEEGQGICDNCKGTGLAVCSFCNGLDIYAADGSVTTCPACNGEKYVTCHVCFGTGKQIELVDNWWEEGVAAQFEK